ncbi:MAG: transferrin-binding protein-like solute binding protein [Pseudomonadota bacterium]
MVRIDAANYGLTVDGETFTFVDGFADVNGSNTQGFARPDLRANHAAVYRLLSGRAINSSVNFSDIAYFVIGAETHPDNFEILSGSVSYSGNIEAVGVRADDLPRAILATGSVELTANFGSNTIAGNVLLTAEDIDYDLSLGTTAITGNGFAGDLTIADCSGVSCTSDSQIGGVFFGSRANEIAGIAQLDLSSTDADGTTSTFTGSGGFTADPELE